MMTLCEYFLKFPHFFHTSSFMFTASSSTIMIFHSWSGLAATLYNFCNLRSNIMGWALTLSVWGWWCGNEPGLASSQGCDLYAWSGMHSLHVNPSHMEMHHKQNHLNFSIRWYFHEQKPGVLKYLLLWNPFLNTENNLFLSCASPVEVKSTGLLITLFKFTYLNISAAGLLFLSTLDSNNKMLFLFKRNCLCNKPFLETTVLLSTRQLESHEEFTTQFLTLYHLHVL